MSSQRHPLRRDRGFTLIEIVVALTLSMVLIAAMTAVLITSMNVASTTDTQIKDSIDLSTVSTFLYRDAQAAGGVDPYTAKLREGIGVSLTDDRGCAAEGDLVVSFSWVDRPDAETQSTYVATYTLTAEGMLWRRLCTDGTKTADVIIGRDVQAVTAECSPNADCSGEPETVVLTMTGSNPNYPLQSVLSASFRPGAQGAPNSGNNSTIALLALGDLETDATCPVVDIEGSSTVTVVGDAVVSSGCGEGAVNGWVKLSPLAPGSKTITPDVNDPFITLPVPSETCPGSGTNPTIGDHPDDTSAFVVYPQTVSVDSAVEFEPGRYVFCDGLSIMSGGAVASTGEVFFYIPSGGFSVASGAIVDLAAQTSGSYANVIAWVSNGQQVTMQSQASVGIWRGYVYAPQSNVVINATDAPLVTNLGGLVARTINIVNAGPSRFGPVPNVGISPDTLDPAVAEADYGPVQFSATGDATAPVTWRAVGLPGGLTLDSATGILVGKPTCSGPNTVVVAAIDASAAGAAKVYDLEVLPNLSITSPLSGSYVRGTVPVTGTVSEPCGVSVAQTVTFEIAKAQDDPADDDWKLLCTDNTEPYTCSWDTVSGTYRESGTTYDLRLRVGTDPNFSYSEIVSVTVDNDPPIATLTSVDGQTTNGATINGLADIIANAYDFGDNGSGVATVTIQYQVGSTSGAWTDACTASNQYTSAPTDYECQFNTGLLTAGDADAIIPTVYFRAVAVDAVGNSDASTTKNFKIDNSSLAVDMAVLPPVIYGTWDIKAAVTLTPGSTLTEIKFWWSKNEDKTGATQISCTVTVSGGYQVCPFDTTIVKDGANDYEGEIWFWATVKDSKNATATATPVGSVMTNAEVRAWDVQATAGLKIDGRVGDIGKVSINDVLILEYSTVMDLTSIIPGWNGSSRNVVLHGIADCGRAPLGCLTGANWAKNPWTAKLEVCLTTSFPTTDANGKPKSWNCTSRADLGEIDLRGKYVDPGKNDVSVGYKYGALQNASISATTRSGRTVITITVGAKMTYYNTKEKRWKDAGVAKWKALNVATTMRFRGRAIGASNPTSRYGILCSTVQMLELGAVDKNF